MKKELEALVAVVDTLSPKDQEKLYGPVNSLFVAADRRDRVISLIQEALDSLRLDLKYLIFDLEATRRELLEARGNV